MLLMAKKKVGRPPKPKADGDDTDKQYSVRVEDPKLQDALARYMAEERPTPVQNDVFVWALQRLLQDKGFYPKKKSTLDDFEGNTKRE